MKTSFLSINEIELIGFKSFGKNIFISRFARFYSPETIQIGNNVRIDDFCILSGEIKLGNFIHLASFNALYGKFGIELEDFTGLSPRCTVFSASDDFSGEFLIGPMVKKELTKVSGGKVHIKKYSQIGCNCVILPSLTIEEGVAVGAMSLVNKDLNAWAIYKGIPAKYYKKRKETILDIKPDGSN